MKAAIQRYREAVAIHYSSPASVRKGNRAVDTMRDIAVSIGEEDEEQQGAFYSLVRESGPISLWAAHHILEIVGGPVAVKRLALARIEQESRRSDAQGLGERMWLADYHRRTTEPGAAPNAAAPPR
jgi:hypothetical protein